MTTHRCKEEMNVLSLVKYEQFCIEKADNIRLSFTYNGYVKK